jgi:Domain of unknown function (DUF4062)
MDRRHQVFVSSTFEDLKIERQRVTRAILALGCLPAGMELFPASDAEAWSVIQRVIVESDYYVLVLSGKYGSIDPTSGLSYTEREYDFAEEVGVPVIPFLRANLGSLPRDLCETDPGLEAKRAAFWEKVKDAHHCKYWENPDNLETQALAGLVYLRDTRSRPGWVRGDTLPEQDVYKELAELRGQVIDLTARLAQSPPARPDVSHLAQGSDRYTVKLLVLVATEPARWTRFTATVDTTWDEILGALGPFLLAEASESKLEVELSNMFAQQLRDNGRLQAASGTRVSIESADFQTIKVQIHELGLIEKSARRHQIGDKEHYWSLTDNGHAALSRVRAIKRPIDAATSAPTPPPTAKGDTHLLRPETFVDPE